MFKASPRGPHLALLALLKGPHSSSWIRRKPGQTWCLIYMAVLKSITVVGHWLGGGKVLKKLQF